MTARGGAALSICVFAGAASGNCPSHLLAAQELGALIAERGHRLVYGAGGIGMMGALARGAVGRGGDVLGVVPRFLRAREAADALPRQNLVVTDDLLARKRLMIDASDAFVALPGGYGTLDEVVEVLSMSALGLRIGPLVLLDVAGHWSPFTHLVDSLRASGFVTRTDLYHVARTPSQALDTLASLLAARHAAARPAVREEEAAAVPPATDG